LHSPGQTRPTSPWAGSASSASASRAGSREKLKAKNSPESDRAQKGSSVPPAPVASKRRRFMDLFDESEEEEEEVVVEKVERKRRPARKLVEEFEKVAMEAGEEAGG
ncbi:hypothetical protein Tsubulata_026093, partial [Turnera subulata]